MTYHDPPGASHMLMPLPDGCGGLLIHACWEEWLPHHPDIYRHIFTVHMGLHVQQKVGHGVVHGEEPGHHKLELFGMDGGTHFDCAEEHTFCKQHDIGYTKTPLIAPWANGLAKESNITLLGRLCRYCQLDFIKDEAGMTIEEMAAHTLQRWPDFFAKVVRRH